MTEQNSIKSDSNISIGFADSTSDTLLTPEEKKDNNIKESEELVSDICQLLIHCERHNKVCVSKVSTKGVWLPSIRIRFNDSRHLMANELLKNCGLNSNSSNDWNNNLLNIFRIQRTQTSDFLVRLTFLWRIPKDSKIKCCLDDNKYKWILVKDVLQSGSDHFLGPELQTWVRFWIKKENVKTVSKCNEYDIRDALKDYSSQSSDCTTDKQVMIRSACYDQKDILRVYDLFVQHCYPSQYMTFSSFKIFIKKIGLKIDENHLIPTFRAFDSSLRSYIDFNELVLGLAAMDQATEHGRQCGQIRSSYLMRFYDSNSDGFLSPSDVSQMISDIQKLPDSPHKNTYDSKKKSNDDYAKQIIQSFGSNNKISIEQFLTAIGSLKLRGTSGLFRSKTSITHALKTVTEKCNLNSVVIVRQNKYEGKCELCFKRQYRISQFVCKMTKKGEALSHNDLNKIFTKTKIDFIKELPETETFELAKEIINKIQEIKSYRLDESSNVHNVQKCPNFWFYDSKTILIEKLLKICQKVKQVFENEERVLRISSPSYVFGDIHGNFKDLMTFSYNFWRMSPLMNESNYLFLGDFVDRGLYGVECIVYLFAMKLISPKNFHILRGNHEVRELQKTFTFYNECVEGYSEDLWNAFNEVFDRLPVAAVIDNRLFCSHGGIPTSVNSIEVLQTIPPVLVDPQGCRPVWEMLWNDPIPDQEFRQLTSFQRIDVSKTHGFLTNTKRGTGYYYSEIAVKNFCQYNDIQHIIRGHEMVYPGYKFLMNGKVITIFSCSDYCFQRNIASVLFINQNKIRVIRVHTLD